MTTQQPVHFIAHLTVNDRGLHRAVGAGLHTRTRQGAVPTLVEFRSSRDS